MAPLRHHDAAVTRHRGVGVKGRWHDAGTGRLHTRDGANVVGVGDGGSGSHRRRQGSEHPTAKRPFGCQRTVEDTAAVNGTIFVHGSNANTWCGHGGQVAAPAVAVAAVTTRQCGVRAGGVLAIGHLWDDVPAEPPALARSTGPVGPFHGLLSRCNVRQQPSRTTSLFSGRVVATVHDVRVIRSLVAAVVHDALRSQPTHGPSPPNDDR